MPEVVNNNTTEAEKIDSKPLVEHVWFHPESGSIFVDIVGPSDGMGADLGEYDPRSIELKVNILDAVDKGASKTEACTIYEKLGWDARAIDPDWIGIF